MSARLSSLDFVSATSTTTVKMILEPGGFKEGEKRREGETERIEVEVEGMSEGRTETEVGIFCRKHKESDTPHQPPHQVQKDIFGDPMGQDGALGITVDAQST